jgi:putative flippase GtrA
VLFSNKEASQEISDSSFVRQDNLIVFVQYVLVSTSALLIDLITFKYLSEKKYFAVPSNAALSYTVGLFWAYFIFIFGVFKNGKLRNQRVKEFIIFAMSGVVGVATSFAVTGSLTTIFVINAWVAKLFAVAISFISVFYFRKKYVF